ncbi:MAG: hypothetical protein BroJett013_18220 [Alphaproteobacteria bacterium]|nr:MAG: hypothetical protein BroJett013_18220 [Alphaproteobacteria bacterium]
MREMADDFETASIFAPKPREAFDHLTPLAIRDVEKIGPASRRYESRIVHSLHWKSAQERRERLQLIDVEAIDGAANVYSKARLIGGFNTLQHTLKEARPAAQTVMGFGGPIEAEL